MKAKDLQKELTEIFKAATGIDADLCGKCFAVCRYTRNYLERSKA